MFSSSLTLKWRDEVYITSLCIWIDLNDLPVTNRKEWKWHCKTSKAESHKTMQLGSYLLAHLPLEPWAPWEKPKHPGAKLWGAMAHGERTYAAAMVGGSCLSSPWLGTRLSPNQDSKWLHLSSLPFKAPEIAYQRLPLCLFEYWP